jgi:hypothetical protein
MISNPMMARGAKGAPERVLAEPLLNIECFFHHDAVVAGWRGEFRQTDVIPILELPTTTV